MATVISLTDDDVGHSGTGWSYYSQWLEGCNMRPWLAKKLGFQSRDSEALALGKIVHKLLDMHEAQGSYQDYVLESFNLKPYVVAQAQRVFANYRVYYPPGHWGRVIERERMIKGTVAGLPYTGRQDGKVKITKAAWNSWAGLGVPTIIGKTYRLDYKTFKPPFDAEMYLNSPQFTGYHQLDPVEGTLVLGINKTDQKRPPAVGLLVPPPTKKDIAILEHCLKLAVAYSKPPFIPNPVRCGRGNYRCPFYLKECDLITVQKEI